MSITVPFHSAFNHSLDTSSCQPVPPTAPANTSFPIVHHMPPVAVLYQIPHPPAMAQPAPRYPQLGYVPWNLTPCQLAAQQIPVPIPPVLAPVPVAPFHNYNLIPYYNVPPLQPPVPAEYNLPYGLPSTLPASSLSLILVLLESKDWTGWNNGVINAVRAIGAMGHLYDTPTNDPLLHLIYPPDLPDDTPVMRLDLQSGKRA